MSDTEKRTAAPPAPKTLPPALAGVLGLLTLVAAIPLAITTSLSTCGFALPGWLLVAGAVGGGFAPLLGAGAYWAAGGNPLDIIRRFAPTIPPPAGPSDGASSRPSDGPPAES